MKFAFIALVALSSFALFAQETKDCCQGEAKKVVAQQEEKACCRSTEAKPMKKGDKGCCNAKGEVAKFKVFVAYEGYKFFGCSDSAAEARELLLAEGYKVGQVQKVTGKNVKIS